MATWHDLERYIRSEYDSVDATAEGRGLTLLFDTGSGRSQLALVTHHEIGDDDWVEIESPIANERDVDPLSLLAEVGKLVCGGLSMTADGIFTLKHSMPIANLDPNEFEDPLFAVVMSADKLEEQLTSADDW